MSASDAIIVGGALIAFALVSKRLAGTALTAAIAFVVVGLVVGTEGLDLLDIDVGSSDLRLIAEVTLALLLFSDAAGLDTDRLRRETGFPLRLLAVGLPLTIAAGSLTAVLMFPDLIVFEAITLAVLLSPTDAALGQAVVTDQRLPSVVRQGLNVESGLNDGVCVPLLLAAVTFAEIEEAPSFDGQVIVELIEELLIAGTVGIAVGALVGLLRDESVRRDWMTASWRLLVPLVTTLVAYAITVDLGGSGFIASFVAGLTYGRLIGPDVHDDCGLTEDLGQLLSAVTFVLFGAVLVGRGISGLELSTVAYAVLSLTVLRMAPVAISLLGSGARAPTVAVAGWFGPRGLATIVFVLTIVDESGLAGTQRIADVATVTVLLSVVAHGLTAPWLVGRYARWFEANRPNLRFETAHVAHVRPTRGRWAEVPSSVDPPPPGDRS
jgi:NhaP-type Na+/H+ or K+/H+ antiporter